MTEPRTRPAPEDSGAGQRLGRRTSCERFCDEGVSALAAGRTIEPGALVDGNVRADELALETHGDLRWRLRLVARRADAHRGNLAGLEINLDVDQCRALNLGLHVIKVSPKPIPKQVI